MNREYWKLGKKKIGKVLLAIILPLYMIFSSLPICSSQVHAAGGEVTFNNVDLLMIYNLLRFCDGRNKEPATDAKAKTGDMSGTIIPAAEKEHVFGNNANIMLTVLSASEEIEPGGHPAEAATDYDLNLNAADEEMQTNQAKPNVGDTKEFYVKMSLVKFTCVAVGEKSVVWLAEGDQFGDSVKEKAGQMIEEYSTHYVSI